MDEPLEIEQEGVGAPAWAAFGDLMAGVLGAFVLVLAAALVGQLDLANQLQAEVAQRQDVGEREQQGPAEDGRAGAGGPFPGRRGIAPEEQLLPDRRDDRRGQQVRDEVEGRQGLG